MTDSCALRRYAKDKPSVPAELISAIHDRPADALMLMKEAYAIYQLLPAHERKLLDETFQLVAAEMDPRRENALTADNVAASSQDTQSRCRGSQPLGKRRSAPSQGKSRCK
jgi:hypothetical protein